ncbi:TPA: hypothetical protein ACIR5Y_003932 [Enterobacter hormaechei]
MSYDNNDARLMHISAVDDEKDVFQALADAEINDHSSNSIAVSSEIKASLLKGKKLSSATLLRKKLRGGLKRELRKL